MTRVVTALEKACQSNATILEVDSEWLGQLYWCVFPVKMFAALDSIFIRFFLSAAHWRLFKMNVGNRMRPPLPLPKRSK
jgi:hypothetical protein